MTTTLETVSVRGTTASHRPTALIEDWAARVVGLWEISRVIDPREDGSGHDLADACRVRDQLNNRLTQTHPDSNDGSEESLETLRDADALFIQVTLQANTAEALTHHNHYARRAEWWWGRQLRLQAA